jgi:small nuclear ribonucleoprotein (snRNP)-like protein
MPASDRAWCDMNTHTMATANRRYLFLLALLAAALLVPRALPAAQPKEELCVSELCDDDSIREVLNRNLHKQVSVVLRSGVELTGVVNKVTDKLLQLTNLVHRNFFDAVVELKEIGAVTLRVRAPQGK